MSAPACHLGGLGGAAGGAGGSGRHVEFSPYVDELGPSGSICRLNLHPGTSSSLVTTAAMNRSSSGASIFSDGVDTDVESLISDCASENEVYKG
eukprot:1176869-Prorocentrum_minimum.AAC.3